MHRILSASSLIVACTLSCAAVHAAESATPAADAPPPRATYLGRRIAPTMHFLGAEWLTRSDREQEERASKMLSNLGVRPGMTVCDMGCGNGYHTLRLAELVGPEGRVLAVDVQREMLARLKERAAEQQVTNVTPILGSPIDPQLPPGEIDVILCVDVYHEFSHPELMLRAMRDSLAPGGRLVLVEYREEDPRVPIRPLHKMSKQQILRELLPNGYRLDRAYDGLPWQHMMFFRTDGLHLSEPMRLRNPDGQKP